MWPKAPVATDEHQNSGYQGLQLAVDPVYQHERKPCDLYVDELGQETHCTMGVRPSVTAKLPVLRPWFWNLILLNLAAFSYYFIASLGGRVRCKHPFIGRCKV